MTTATKTDSDQLCISSIWRENIKSPIYTVILILAFGIVVLSQEPKVVLRPVEGSEPFIMTTEELENLEVPASMDRFGKISSNVKKARLDLFTSLVSSENKMIEFVVELKGRTKQETSKNMEFIYNYLVVKKKLEPMRISFAIAPEGEQATELWLIPNNDISIPTCKDCPIVQAEDEEKLKKYFQLKKSGR